MELTPEIAKAALVRYLWGEGILPHPEADNEENQIPPFLLVAIDYITVDRIEPSMLSVDFMNKQTWRLLHFLGTISIRFTHLRNWSDITEGLLDELVERAAQHRGFTDEAVIRAIQATVSYWLRTPTKLQSVAYQFAGLIEVAHKISFALNDIDHSFPITKHTKQ